MISTTTHGAIDYIVAAVLVLAPFLLGFATGGAAQWVPIVLGGAIALYSLVTAYEFGALRLIPFRVHLGLDAIGGLILIASPWLFGFADVVIWPHVLVGLAELAVVAMSARRTPHTHA